MLLDISLIGLALSMDAVAISMTNCIVYKNLTNKKKLLMPLYFGLFQGLMPVIGYFAGTMFSDFINKYAGIFVFAILTLIGGKMIYEGVKHDEDEASTTQSILTNKILIVQAIATSIDALAVGIGFHAMKAPVLVSSLLIAIITFICSFVAIKLGKKFATLFENKSEILGGVILCLIGIKALL